MTGASAPLVVVYVDINTDWRGGQRQLLWMGEGLRRHGPLRAALDTEIAHLRLEGVVHLTGSRADPDSLESAASVVVTSSRANLSRKLSAGARARAPLFTIERTVDRTMEIYRERLAEGAGVP